MTDCQHDGQYVCPGCGSVFDARHVRDTGCEGLREALEALTSTLESIEFRVSILGMACSKKDSMRLAEAHTQARAALAAPAASPEEHDD